MINTAVFGGAFNPVHTEHINIARAAVKELSLNRLILVPTYHPPHKKESDVSFSDRAEMLKIAFKHFPCEVIISDIEARNLTKSYASDTLPALKSLYGDFYYIIGGDSLQNFELWYKPEFIAKNFKIAVFNRAGYPDVKDKIKELNERWSAHFIPMSYAGGDFDSHTLRYKICLQTYDKGLPDGVLEYINEHRLYGCLYGYLDKIPAYLTENRLLHSKNTAYFAVCLNDMKKLGLDGTKVMMAGLLHDLGKKYDGDEQGAKRFSIPPDSIGTSVQHQFISAEIAKTDFGIIDGDILSAIRYHTTGRANMSVLEKLIYCADMVSAERDYPRVADLRASLKKDFNIGFAQCLQYSYDYLLENNKNIYPLTTEAINFYKEIQ